MIDEKYINEAVDIRKEYLKSMTIVVEKENTINTYRDELIVLMDQMDEYMKSNSVDPTILNSRLIDLEQSMNRIQNEIRPMNDKIDVLKKRSNKLYSIIRENYPDISDEEIRNEIEPRIVGLEQEIFQPKK